jgi:hypothetical protein
MKRKMTIEARDFCAGSTQVMEMQRIRLKTVRRAT